MVRLAATLNKYLLSNGTKMISRVIFKRILITIQKCIAILLLTFPAVMCEHAFSVLQLNNKILEQLKGQESLKCLTVARCHMKKFPCEHLHI
jgi:hypothetical protein